MRLILLVALLSRPLCAAETFTVAPKKSKQSKVTPHDCCAHIMQEMQSFARISCYSGQIESFELAWVEDFFEDETNALLKKVSQEQLQKYIDHKQTFNAALAQYEKLLQQERDFLKQFEQEVRAPKKKK